MSHAIIMPCLAWAEKLAMGHSDDLSASEREALEKHLVTCPQCTTVRSHYQEVTTLLSEIPIDDVPANLPPRLVQIWEEEQKEQKMRKITDGLIETVKSAKMHTITRKKRWLPISGVIAAMLLLSIIFGTIMTHYTGRQVRIGGNGGQAFSPSPISQVNGSGSVAFSPSPVFWQSNVYITLGSEIAAFRGDNGSLIRKYTVENQNRPVMINPGGPAIADGIMYVIGRSSSLDTGVYALRISDGSLLWHAIMQGTSRIPESLIVIDGMVYVTMGGLHPSLDAFRASNGTRLWSYQTNNPDTGGLDPVIISQGVAYIGINVNKNLSLIAALQTSNGKRLWQQEIDQPYITLTQANGILLVGTRDFYEALRSSDGSQLWHDSIPDDRYTLSDKTVYMMDRSGLLTALQAGNRVKLWSTQMTAANSSELTVANSMIYIRIFSGIPTEYSIYALKISNGHELWQYKIGTNPILEPAYGDNALYMTTFTKGQEQLRAIRTDNGHELWHKNILP